MNRLFIATILGSAAVISILIAWNTVKEDREYRRLLSVGDTTLSANQTFGSCGSFQWSARNPSRLYDCLS